MRAETTDLIEESGRIAGLRAKTPSGLLEIRPDLIVAADGKSSILPEGGLEGARLGCAHGCAVVQAIAPAPSPTDRLPIPRPMLHPHGRASAARSRSRDSTGSFSNFCVTGSNLTMAFALHWVNHTLSWSSTHTEYACGLPPGSFHSRHARVARWSRHALGRCSSNSPRCGRANRTRRAAHPAPASAVR